MTDVWRWSQMAGAESGALLVHVADMAARKIKLAYLGKILSEEFMEPAGFSLNAALVYLRNDVDVYRKSTEPNAAKVRLSGDRRLHLERPRILAQPCFEFERRQRAPLGHPGSVGLLGASMQ
jgi:hypothetical protein